MSKELELIADALRNAPLAFNADLLAEYMQRRLSEHGYSIVPRKELEVGGPKLAAIRDLHVRDQNGDWMCHEDECEACVYGNGHQGPICSYCSDSTNEEHGVITWPCPTMQIIDGLSAPGLRRAAGGES